MRELSKIEIEQVSGGCLSEVFTGVNTLFTWFTSGLRSLFSGIFGAATSSATPGTTTPGTTTSSTN
ncbi:hypothetical protein O4444_07760 [Xylella fastidiosa subsp. pauca]|uniref:hypothetical protein n=1 Tax=Xylella fastidiosa TaxID=2371 RepID=UPI0009B5BBDB|nr:hypothetical protein [Xylella fastidiosa]WGZ31413.1 hypothetical protein O4444_07760 [Xylella fastidiosa subsp. pauca]